MFTLAYLFTPQLAHNYENMLVGNRRVFTMPAGNARERFEVSSNR
jgi:hypothetical protein